MRFFVYDGQNVEQVDFERGMRIYSGKMPLAGHAMKVIWLVEVRGDAIAGLAPVPLDEYGVAHQQLIQQRIVAILDGREFKAVRPINDFLSRAYCAAIQSPPDTQVLVGKIPGIRVPQQAPA